MNTEAGTTVAVLLHLATSRRLDEFVDALTRIEMPYDVIVNLPRLDGGAESVAQRREHVRRAFPGSVIIESDNRGMDVGGMLRLFQRALSGSWRFWLYLHSKSDDAWRGAMLDAVTVNAGRALDLMSHVGRTTRHNPVGMAGAWVYPFDYYNIGPFLDLLDELGVTLITDWERYYARYPEARTLPLSQRVRHAASPGRRALRPEVDLEYARMLFGDLHAARQPMNPTRLRQMITEGVLGALHYFPGNYFWIRRDVVESLADSIDLDAACQRLAPDVRSDRDRQSLAHAWERALPVFAAKRGYALVQLGADAGADGGANAVTDDARDR